MTNLISPALIFIFGSFFIPLLKGKARQFYLLILPIIAFIGLINLQEGSYNFIRFLGYNLALMKVDKLNMVFGYVFVLMAFMGFIYSIHLKESGQHIAAALYVGSSLGVIFTGNVITLFIFWEIMAFSSTYLIWARKTKSSFAAGMRYILVHIFGGLSLLAGIIIQIVQTGSTDFGLIDLKGIGAYLILIGFMLNAAVPPLSAWLSDAYPEATVTGAVFLSAYTTKTAIYVLMRAFPGADILIWLGAIMAFYGVIFAVLENDIRRILAYHIISQVGYMVCGIGIGTTLSLNGAAAHAFSHIIYKGLLFMGAGAVLHITGKSKLTELGGLYKTMPITFVLYMIGAFSISAFPLFSGFVSKSMIVTASADENMGMIWLLLSIASSGTFLHTGLKLPYWTWFGKNQNMNAKEPPVNMIVAMIIASFISILIGIRPDILYNILPFEVNYQPYTSEHIVWTMEFLLLTAVGFFMFLKYLAGQDVILLDTDWFYRKGGACLVRFMGNPLKQLSDYLKKMVFEKIPSSFIWFSKNPTAALQTGIDSILIAFVTTEHKSRIRNRIDARKSVFPGHIIKHWPVSQTVLWITIFLLVYLLLYYIN